MLKDRGEHRPMRVGVMGLGDLGGKLAAQMLAKDMEVVAYDPAVLQTEVLLPGAIDPLLDSRVPTENLKVADDPCDVLACVDLVHWAVPSSLLLDLPPVRPTQTVVLHDSVMGTSLAMARTRDDAARFQVVHCLMNSAKRVLVATDGGCIDEVVRHLSGIGLAPKLTTVQQHDRMIARTQGIFALLISLGLGDELQRYAEDGDLTPSALELERALQHRQSKWTKNTVQSILSNGELAAFLDDLRGVVPAHAV